MLQGRDNIRGGNTTAMIDGLSSSIITVDSNHGKIHQGEAFTMANKMDVATAQVGAIQFSFPAGTAAAITSNMTAANADLTYTAKAVGTYGNAISVVHVNPGAASQALAVSVVGSAITVSLATGSNSAISSTAAQVAAAVNLHSEATKLVTVTAEGTGAGLTNALAVANLSGGVNTVYAHFKPAKITSTLGPCIVSLLEDYTFTGGSALTPMNRRRTGTPPTSAVTMKGLANATASAGSAAKSLDMSITPSATGPGFTSAGGSTSAAEEWVLKPGVNYLLTITNNNAATSTVGYELFWYEESLG